MFVFAALSKSKCSFLNVANTKIKRVCPPLETPGEWSSKLGSCTLVGSGGFGCVYACDLKCAPSDGAKVAVKQVKVKNEDIADLQRELDMLHKMNGSEYVLSSAGSPAIQVGNNVFVMTELLNLGSLHDVVEVFLLGRGGLRGMDPEKYVDAASKLPANKKTSYQSISSNSVVLALFYQAVRGVKELHDLNLVHLDLKLENVMVSEHNGEVYAAVIDLGMVRESGAGACRGLGTPGYMEPDAFDLSCSQAKDVWALGVMLYIILLGEWPPFWKNVGKRARLDYDASTDLKEKLDEPGTWRRLLNMVWTNEEQQLVDLIQKMLQPKPEKRIKVDVLLEKLKKVTESYTTKDDDSARVTRMLDSSPSDYGAKVPTPDCLDKP